MNSPPLNTRDPRVKDSAVSRDPRLKQKPVEVDTLSPFIGNYR